jgi:nonspecific dipeptidase
MFVYFDFAMCCFQQAQSSEEPFPTTSEDLAGFWDMVMLQVEHVNKLFEEIMALRAADWVEVNSNLQFLY